MLGWDGTRAADYVDLAQAIVDQVEPAHIRDYLGQLYRRMTFNVLAGDRDDHLLNHGFLRHASGWRLAPAFDLNPAGEMRGHATPVNGRTVAPTAADALDVRSFFGLSEREARRIVKDVANVITGWRSVATEAGIGRVEQDEVASALSALDSATAT